MGRRCAWPASAAPPLPKGSAPARAGWRCASTARRARARASARRGTRTATGVDDDCDGFVDEAIAPTPCADGRFTCRVEGEAACVDGARICDAVARAPRVERCNAVDDDCDGAVDEIAECQGPRCGNGVLEEGEQCDGDAYCDAECQFEWFRETESNGRVEWAEDIGDNIRIMGRAGWLGGWDDDFFAITIEEPTSLTIACDSLTGNRFACLGGTHQDACRSMSLSGPGDAWVTSQDPLTHCNRLEPGQNPALRRLEPGTYILEVNHDGDPGDPLYGIYLQFGPPMAP